MFTRRKLLQNLAGAALGSTLTSPALAQDDPFGGFTVGIQSYTLRNFKELDRVLQMTHDLGLGSIEIFRGHLATDSSDDAIKAAVILCQKHKVAPLAFGVERFTKDHDANQKLFEFGKKLGIKYFSADPDPDSFDSLDKLVAQYNIAIAIHPHGPAGKGLHRWHSAEVIMKAVQNHHRLIGTCLDTGHLIRSAQNPFNLKLDPAQQIRVMGARNFGLHLKDHDNEKRTDVVYGKGVLDVPGILRALREVKFQGYISIEYEANPNNPIPDVQACLEVFKESVKKLG